MVEGWGVPSCQPRLAQGHPGGLNFCLQLAARARSSWALCEASLEMKGRLWGPCFPSPPVQVPSLSLLPAWNVPPAFGRLKSLLKVAS